VVDVAIVLPCGARVNVPVAVFLLDRYLPPDRGQESYMTTSHAFSPPMERPVLDVGILRAGVLALIALIVGSMFAYDLVLSSPQTPLPRPRPNALGTAAVHTDHRVGQLPSNHPFDTSG
jgi:hypothetical protein